MCTTRISSSFPSNSDVKFPRVGRGGGGGGGGLTVRSRSIVYASSAWLLNSEWPYLHLSSALLYRERERNVLFNDALNTFYLRLYGVRHMVKDHSDSEKGNPLPPHRLLLSINSKGSFICTIPQTG